MTFSYQLNRDNLWFKAVPSGTTVTVGGEEFRSGDKVTFKHDGVEQCATIFQILTDDCERVIFEVLAYDYDEEGCSGSGLLKIGAMTRRGLGRFYVKDEDGRIIASL